MNSLQVINLKINHKDISVPVSPGQTLAEVLRETLNLSYNFV